MKPGGWLNVRIIFYARLAAGYWAVLIGVSGIRVLELAGDLVEQMGSDGLWDLNGSGFERGLSV